MAERERRDDRKDDPVHKDDGVELSILITLGPHFGISPRNKPKQGLVAQLEERKDFRQVNFLLVLRHPREKGVNESQQRPRGPLRGREDDFVAIERNQVNEQDEEFHEDDRADEDARVGQVLRIERKRRRQSNGAQTCLFTFWRTHLLPLPDRDADLTTTGLPPHLQTLILDLHQLASGVFSDRLSSLERRAGDIFRGVGSRAQRATDIGRARAIRKRDILGVKSKHLLGTLNTRFHRLVRSVHGIVRG